MAVKFNFDRALMVALVVCLVVGGGLSPRSYTHKKIGDKENKTTKAPAVRTSGLPEAFFFDATDKKTTLADFRGRVVLVNLWATWCPPCVVELPALNALQAKLKDKDFSVVAIAMDNSTLPSIQTFLRARDVPQLAVYWDKERQIPMKWRYEGLPVSFLLDKNGDLVETFEGPKEWDKGPLYDKIVALAEK